VLNNIFALSFPEGWNDSTVYTFDGPVDNGVTQNLVLIIDRTVDKTLELQSYVNSQIENLSQSLPGYELLQKKEAVVAGCHALIVVYKYIPADDLVYFQKQHYIHNDKALYIFTSTYSEKTLKTVSPEIDAIVENIVFFDERTIRELMN
jgi:hypothetical protein